MCGMGFDGDATKGGTGGRSEGGVRLQTICGSHQCSFSLQIDTAGHRILFRNELRVRHSGESANGWRSAKSRRSMRSILKILRRIPKRRFTNGCLRTASLGLEPRTSRFTALALPTENNLRFVRRGPLQLKLPLPHPEHREPRRHQPPRGARGLKLRQMDKRTRGSFRDRCRGPDSQLGHLRHQKSVTVGR